MDFDNEVIEINEEENDLTNRIIVKKEFEDFNDTTKHDPPESPKKQIKKKSRHLHENVPVDVPVPAKNFKNKRTFHKRNSDGNINYSWKCHECLKCFSSKSSLGMHEQIHTDSTKTCPVCFSSHKNAPSLRQHLYMHRKRGEIEAIPKIDIPKKDKTKTKFPRGRISGTRDQVAIKKEAEEENKVAVKREIENMVKNEIEDKKIIKREVEEVKLEKTEVKEEMLEDSSDSDVDFSNMDLRTFIKGNYNDPLEAVRGLPGFSGAPPDLKHVCDVCCSKFATHTKLINHIKSKHFGIKQPKTSLYCFICRREFTNKHGFDGHMDTHNSIRTMYTCEYCQTQFLWKCTLAKHIKKYHLN